MAAAPELKKRRETRKKIREEKRKIEASKAKVKEEINS